MTLRWGQQSRRTPVITFPYPRSTVWPQQKPSVDFDGSEDPSHTKSEHFSILIPSNSSPVFTDASIKDMIPLLWRNESDTIDK